MMSFIAQTGPFVWIPLVLGVVSIAYAIVWTRDTGRMAALRASVSGALAGVLGGAFATLLGLRNVFEGVAATSGDTSNLLLRGGAESLTCLLVGLGFALVTALVLLGGSIDLRQHAYDITQRSAAQ